MKHLVRFGLALVLVLASLAHAQTVIYVDKNADQEPHDGSSWCHAYLELYEALPAGSDTVIRVANGTYKPTAGTDRTATFQLIDGVTLQGGYAGCNDGGDLRDITVYETILSGDIGASGNNTDNSYHVITGSGTNATAVLDGFTITAGNDDRNWPNGTGAGMYIDAGCPTLTNCTFTLNTAKGSGGGLYNTSSSPTLTDCVFSNNSAENAAGGMDNKSASSPSLTNCVFRGNSGNYGGGMRNEPACSPLLSNCTFVGNSAMYGAGMFNWGGSAPELTQCMFSGNRADVDGGGIANDDSSPVLTDCTFSGNSATDDGGGVDNISQSHATFINCVFTGNSAVYGAGMRNDDSSPTLTNCTFSGNTAGTCGGAIYSWTSSTVLGNCILWGNTPEEIYAASGDPVVTHSCLQGGWAGEGNTGANPLLAGDFRLAPGSPCIDAGNNAVVAPDIAIDLHGMPRFYDDPATPNTGSGEPPVVDMGAYEYVLMAPAGSADLDGDGDVDVDDFALFLQQFTGPLP